MLRTRDANHGRSDSWAGRGYRAAANTVAWAATPAGFLCLIALASFVLRLGIVDNYLAIKSDMGSYLMTKNWLLGLDPNGEAQPLHFRPPLIGVMLLPFTWLFGDLLGAQVLAILSSVLLAIPAYFLLRRVSNRWLAVVGTLVILYLPNTILMTMSGFISVINLAFILWAWLGIIWYLQDNRSIWHVIIPSLLVVGTNQTTAALFAISLPLVVLFLARPVHKGVLLLVVLAVVNLVWWPFYDNNLPREAISVPNAAFLAFRFSWQNLMLFGMFLGTMFSGNRYAQVFSLVGLLFALLGFFASSNTSVENLLSRASLFAPVIGVIVGISLLSQIKWPQTQLRPVGVLVVGALLLSLAHMGWSGYANEVAAKQNIITPTNLAAMHWIQQHSTKDDRILAHPMGLAWYTGGYAQRYWYGTWAGPTFPIFQQSHEAYTCTLNFRANCDPYQLRDEFGVKYLLVDTNSDQWIDKAPRNYDTLGVSERGWQLVAAAPWLHQVWAQDGVYIYEFQDVDQISYNLVPTDLPVPTQSPTQVKYHDGFLYVVSQEGHVYRDGELYADLTDTVFYSEKGPELGLQSVEFHDGYMYAGFTGASNYLSTSRFPVEDGQVQVDAEERLFDVARFKDDVPEDWRGDAKWVHGGGHVLAGPDGYLYGTFGEGHFEDAPPHMAAQDRDNLLGSVIRWKPGSPEGYEVVAIGFRNPWRMAFAGDRLIVTDVGQGTWEEVNLVWPGGNYGWPYMEGEDCYGDARRRIGDDRPETVIPCDPSAFETPAFAYPHSNDYGQRCAVIGGVVWRDSYVFGDLCSGESWGMSIENVGNVWTLIDTDLVIRGYEIINGDLYMLALKPGEGWGIYRIEAGVK